MAGAKGKSGGARPGAGRPRKNPLPPGAPLSIADAPPAANTPLDFLKGVMNDPKQPLAMRVRSAIAAAQYEHVKRGDSGKREDQAVAAKKAAAGRFAPPKPPKLIVSNG